MLCFVIQPFDSEKFDQRFEDIYKPALADAGLEAYRVDQDPSVEVPIEAIEDGIRKAAICLADITTDNPNVWYELGYAFAADRPVIIICSDERQGRFPFDIQHRTIISYSSNSLSDFEKLKSEISERAGALLTKSASLKQVAETEQTAPIKGLSQIEILVLAVLAGDTAIPESGTSLHSLKNDAIRSGLTPVGFGLAFRRLINKSFIEITNFVGYEGLGEPFDCEGAQITSTGWKWIEDNESFFVLKKNKTKTEDIDDDLPF